ncbi:MAG: hypothetical protein NT028_08410, partial [candidate division Zixibacteria bacterium]|nr:hypothetical protein [candidate division Zixibacteria bacterium]
FSNLNLELEEVTTHHSDVEAALRKYYLPDGERAFLPAKFVGYTKQELYSEFCARIEELEQTSSLTLLSSLEASLRIDYLNRCDRKKKDDLSREFRLIYKKQQSNISLEDGILEAWKRHCPELNALISEVIAVFKYRHWLAHGRYWKPKLGRKYDYSYIYSLTKLVYDRLPLLRQ